ncbi:MAG: diaminopimelate decarboxylase, partial [Candidatus Thermofonsia Clade 3 bacterium]
MSENASVVQRRLELLPITAAYQPSAEGSAGSELTIGGCCVRALAEQFGTPLYCFDAATLDAAAEQYRTALRRWYPAESAVTYAGKAYLSRAIVQWAQRHDFWLDCTGAGEIGIAVAAGAPRQRILVHGVNKSEEDLDAAVAHAGVIVVDNLTELQRLALRLRNAEDQPTLWLRVRP